MSDREMSEQDTQFSLGKLIGESSKRDAIHIAVAPVVATERLSPGQHIGLVHGDAGRVEGASKTPIGIVDPFLPGPVFTGDRFFMFIYPNTITSLRHQWTHPLFESATISRDAHIVKSKDWIKAHAEEMDLTVNALMADAERWIQQEDYRVQHDSEHWRDTFNPTEFWHHYEVVTGKVVDEKLKQSFYCCTC